MTRYDNARQGSGDYSVEFADSAGTPVTFFHPAPGVDKVKARSQITQTFPQGTIAAETMLGEQPVLVMKGIEPEQALQSFKAGGESFALVAPPQKKWLDAWRMRGLASFTGQMFNLKAAHEAEKHGTRSKADNVAHLIFAVSYAVAAS